MKHDTKCWCGRHCALCGREANVIDSRGAQIVMLCADHANEQSDDSQSKD